MSWELTDIGFDESQGDSVSVEFVNAVSGMTSIGAEELAFRENGVTLARTTGMNGRFVAFVPWSNIRAVHQTQAV
jgi:hypothetical protein